MTSSETHAKICPYCGTRQTKGDAFMVCPACGYTFGTEIRCDSPVIKIKKPSKPKPGSAQRLIPYLSADGNTVAEIASELENIRIEDLETNDRKTVSRLLATILKKNNCPLTFIPRHFQKALLIDYRANFPYLPRRQVGAEGAYSLPSQQWLVKHVKGRNRALDAWLEDEQKMTGLIAQAKSNETPDSPKTVQDYALLLGFSLLATWLFCYTGVLCLIFTVVAAFKTLADNHKGAAATYATARNWTIFTLPLGAFLWIVKLAFQL